MGPFLENQFYGLSDLTGREMCDVSISRVGG